MSDAILGATGRLLPHDRGKVVVHLLLVLAGGGECCADIEYLRAQRALFPDVCSDSTLYRAVCALTPAGLGDVMDAVATIRGAVWRGLTEQVCC